MNLRPQPTFEPYFLNNSMIFFVNLHNKPVKFQIFSNSLIFNAYLKQKIA